MTRMVDFFGCVARWVPATALMCVAMTCAGSLQAQDSGAPPWGEFLRQFGKDPLLKKAFHQQDEKEPKGLAAKIRARELDVPNRIRAIRYLSELDCGQFPEARDVLLEQLNPEKERWPEVRLAAAEGLRDMLGRNCKATRNSKDKSGKSTLSYGPSCCSAETLQTLARTAYEMKPNGGCYEPSLEVRRMAVEAIRVCGIPCHYSPYVGKPEVGPEPQEEAGQSEAAPGEPTPPKKTEEPAVKPTPEVSASVIPRLSEICIVALKNHEYRRADPAFSREHKGRIYHFSSAEAQAQFDAEPEKFAVAFGGCDPVAYVRSGAIEDGRFLINHEGRSYMFSSAENAKTFKSAPERYLPSARSGAEIVSR